MSTTPTHQPPFPIAEVAARLGIDRRHLVPYGDDKAKVRLAARDAASDGGRPPGKLILVSAITPTGAGEGKTTTSIGLAQGLAKLGERACLALREPSLGPTFGMKGGATGGGKSVVVPAEDINLHFTGDFHAITAAHNLLAALLDNHLHQGNALGIDPRRVLWRRVLDMNDRASAPDGDRPRRRARGGAAGDRLRHHRRLRGHGLALPGRGRRGPARPASPACWSP